MTTTIDRHPELVSGSTPPHEPASQAEAWMLKPVQHDGVRTNWSRHEITALFDLPFDELMFRAQTIHRAHHAAGEVQLCTLLSIKTGGCPEDCGYCSQSASADTGLKAEKLMDVDAVLASAAEAKAAGSQRFCMGAAWREPKDRDMDAIVEGLRVCAIAAITVFAVRTFAWVFHTDEPFGSWLLSAATLGALIGIPFIPIFTLWTRWETWQNNKVRPK